MNNGVNDDKLRAELVEVRSAHSRLYVKTLYSLLAGLLGVATGLLSVFSTRGLSGIVPLLLTALLVLALLAVVQVAITFGLDRLARGPSEAARLKKQVVAAYRAALEMSPINPTPAGGEPHG
jgi:hypothetical protein